MTHAELVKLIFSLPYHRTNALNGNIECVCCNAVLGYGTPDSALPSEEVHEPGCLMAQFKVEHGGYPREAYIARQFLNGGDPAEVLDCIRGVFADGAATLAVKEAQELPGAVVFARMEDRPE